MYNPMVLVEMRFKMLPKSSLSLSLVERMTREGIEMRDCGKAFVWTGCLVQWDDYVHEMFEEIGDHIEPTVARVYELGYYGARRALIREDKIGHPKKRPMDEDVHNDINTAVDWCRKAKRMIMRVPVNQRTPEMIDFMANLSGDI